MVAQSLTTADTNRLKGLKLLFNLREELRHAGSAMDHMAAGGFPRLPLQTLQFLPGMVLVLPAETEIGDEGPTLRHVERRRCRGRIEDRHPAQHQTACARGKFFC